MRTVNKKKNNNDLGRVFDYPVADIDMQELLKKKASEGKLVTTIPVEQISLGPK
jgi:hypothetical protein